jgi:hypothetical protein
MTAFKRIHHSTLQRRGTQAKDGQLVQDRTTRPQNFQAQEIDSGIPRDTLSAGWHSGAMATQSCNSNTFPPSPWVNDVGSARYFISIMTYTKTDSAFPHEVQENTSYFLSDIT